jgi:hypothetical protein
MTAEIAIMNKSGLALAADSKVTIGSGSKTFDTVTKIFSISRVHPIALMVWGNPDFMEYPIEIICKEYRARKGQRSEPTVQAWADDFVKYLESFSEHDDDIQSNNVQSILGSWLESITEDAVDDAKRNGVTIPSADYIELLTSHVKQATDNASGQPDFLADSDLEQLLNKFITVIQSIVEAYVGVFANQSLTDAATMFCVTAIVKNIYSPHSMGFVVAGYGDNEFFPGLVEFETDGYILDRIKINRKKPVNVSRKMRAFVKPFAQVDMVQRFMRGADPEYTSYTNTLFKDLMVRNCLDVLEKFGAPENKSEEVKKLIEAAISQSADESASTIANFQKDNFSDPILNMVVVLPKDELPHLAESLVAP